jgi:iron complex transport system substrate-binding protein
MKACVLVLGSLAVLLAACAQREAPSEAQADPAAFSRIISLDGTLTEIVWTLGDSAALVGRDVTSSYPEGVSALPNLGHSSQHSLEAILALKPDLIVARKDQISPTLLQGLALFDIRVMLFEPEYSPAGAAQLIRQVGERLQRQDQADALALRMLDQVEQVQRQIARQRSAAEPSVLFVYAGSGGNLLIAGKDTPVDAMISLAGGRNVGGALSGFQALTPEFILQAAPDFVLVFPHVLAALGGVEGMRSNPVLGKLEAVNKGKVMVMDGLLLTGFGPRLHTALATLQVQWYAADNKSLPDHHNAAAL